MKSIVILFALVASCYAGGLLQEAPVQLVQAAPAVSFVQQKLIAAPPAISYVQQNVPTGVSHTLYSVPESRFTRSDWETDGATYAIPGVAKVAITQPGFTQYIPTSIKQQTVVKHQPLLVQSAPIFAAPKLVAAPLLAAPVTKILQAPLLTKW